MSVYLGTPDIGHESVWQRDHGPQARVLHPVHSPGRALHMVCRCLTHPLVWCRQSVLPLLMDTLRARSASVSPRPSTQGTRAAPSSVVREQEER